MNRTVSLCLALPLGALLLAPLAGCDRTDVSKPDARDTDASRAAAHQQPAPALPQGQPPALPQLGPPPPPVTVWWEHATIPGRLTATITGIPATSVIRDLDGLPIVLDSTTVGDSGRFGGFGWRGTRRLDLPRINSVTQVTIFLQCSGHTWSVDVQGTAGSLDVVSQGVNSVTKGPPFRAVFGLVVREAPNSPCLLTVTE